MYVARSDPSFVIICREFGQMWSAELYISNSILSPDKFPTFSLFSRLVFRLPSLGRDEIHRIPFRSLRCYCCYCCCNRNQWPAFRSRFESSASRSEGHGYRLQVSAYFWCCSRLTSKLAAPQHKPSGTPPASTCSTGNQQCCDTVSTVSDPFVKMVAAAVGAILPVGNAMVGLSCTPIASIVGGGRKW